VRPDAHRRIDDVEKRVAGVHDVLAQPGMAFEHLLELQRTLQPGSMFREC
jgi:hypothetical protein